MRLTLSSSAAPEESLGGLLEACARKGISGLELVDGDGHGVGLRAGSPLGDLRALAHRAGIELTGFRLAARPRLDDADIDRIGEELGTPILVPVASDGDLVPVARAAERLSAEGVRVAAASPDAGVLTRSALMGCPLDVAWDVVPGCGDPDDVERLLDAAGPALTHVRLFGGGPESAAQGGTGVGTLMSRLARMRFPGALVVTPSSPRYRVAWRVWLGRSRGWGCSGRATPSEPLALRGKGAGA